MRQWEQRYLHRCSFKSEKNQRTGDKLLTLIKKVCCQLTSTGRPVLFAVFLCPTRSICGLDSNQKRKSRRDSENEQNRIFLERQKKEILAEVRTEIQKHDFQTDYDRRSIQELNGIIESQWREIDHALADDEQLRWDQLLQEQLPEQNPDLREAHIKSLHEMDELKWVQGSRFDEFSKRRLIENQDTINELTVRIQELHNEVNCKNDSRDF